MRSFIAEIRDRIGNFRFFTQLSYIKTQMYLIIFDSPTPFVSADKQIVRIWYVY